MNEMFTKHGAFTWSELYSPDMNGSKKFYAELFGWELETCEMTDMPYTVIKIAGTPRGGMMQLTPQMEGIPPHWAQYVAVDDVDEAARKVAALGGQVLMPPFDIPNVGRMCVIMDPQGASLCLITYPKAEA